MASSKLGKVNIGPNFLLFMTRDLQITAYYPVISRAAVKSEKRSLVLTKLQTNKNSFEVLIQQKV